jgi:hypothetical protein
LAPIPARVHELLLLAGDLMAAKTFDDAGHRWDDLETALLDVNERIGERVRDLFGA